MRKTDSSCTSCSENTPREVARLLQMEGSLFLSFGATDVRRETSTETYFSHWLAEVNKCQCTTARLENDSPIVVPLLQSRGVLRMQRCQHHSKLVFRILQAFKKPNQRQRSGQPKEWERVRESDLYYSVHLSGFMIISSESETWFWFIYIYLWKAEIYSNKVRNWGY